MPQVICHPSPPAIISPGISSAEIQASDPLSGQFSHDFSDSVAISELNILGDADPASIISTQVSFGGVETRSLATNIQDPWGDTSVAHTQLLLPPVLMLVNILPQSPRIIADAYHLPEYASWAQNDFGMPPTGIDRSYIDPVLKDIFPSGPPPFINAPSEVYLY